MSRAIFVSDIHISSSTDLKADLFLRLLDECVRKGVNEIYLVGDIFDFWIADRSVFTREYAQIIIKIRQLTHRRIKVHYFEGNHDLDLRRFWQDQLGAYVHSEAQFFNINGFNLRVEHGDQMDPDDRGYLFLRWLLRTPLLVLLGRYLPNFLVTRIGRRASHTSRDYTSQVKVVSDEQVREKIHRHAGKIFAEQPFDILICGHVHVAEDSIVEFNGRNVRCINMGTWLKKPIMFEINNKSAELKSVEEFIEE